jgi:predicted nucleic acid-binding Zn ribbon protein
MKTKIICITCGKMFERELEHECSKECKNKGFRGFCSIKCRHIFEKE